MYNHCAVAQQHGTCATRNAGWPSMHRHTMPSTLPANQETVHLGPLLAIQHLTAAGLYTCTHQNLPCAITLLCRSAGSAPWAAPGDPAPPLPGCALAGTLSGM